MNLTPGAAGTGTSFQQEAIRVQLPDSQFTLGGSSTGRAPHVPEPTLELRHHSSTSPVRQPRLLRIGAPVPWQPTNSGSGNIIEGPGETPGRRNQELSTGHHCPTASAGCEDLRPHHTPGCGPTWQGSCFGGRWLQVQILPSRRMHNRCAFPRDDTRVSAISQPGRRLRVDFGGASVAQMVRAGHS